MILEERGEAVGAFGFHRFRPARLVPLGPGLALRRADSCCRRADKLGVLAVRGDDDAQFPRKFERLVHLAIVHAEEVLVGEKDLEGTDAIGDNLAQLAFGLRRRTW